MKEERIQEVAKEFVTWYIHNITPVLQKRCAKQDKDCIYAETCYDGYKQLFIDALAYTLYLQVGDKFYEEAGVLNRYKFDKRTLVRISNKMSEFFDITPTPDLTDDDKKMLLSLAVMRVSLTVYYAQREMLEGFEVDE
jgi:hypothetical protein